MKLSDHFSLGEFTREAENRFSPTQIFLLQSICQNILEPMRAFLSCPIKVVSGVRTRGDYDRLIKQGYHPSETSDHFFGETVPLSRATKIQRFGPTYSYSVGAADIMPACSAEEAFSRMRQYFRPATGIVELPNMNVKIGQLILERSKTYWLHVSNPATLVYSEIFADRYLKKAPFLMSLDNGKSYQPVT